MEKKYIYAAFSLILKIRDLAETEIPCRMLVVSQREE